VAVYALGLVPYALKVAHQGGMLVVRPLFLLLCVRVTAVFDFHDVYVPSARTLPLSSDEHDIRSVGVPLAGCLCASYAGVVHPCGDAGGNRLFSHRVLLRRLVIVMFANVMHHHRRSFRPFEDVPQDQFARAVVSVGV
jgi:hypothetical protein